MTSASAGSPLTLSLKVPWNAEGCTPVPSAEVIPVTPLGRSFVTSSTLTPLVSSRGFLAAASTCSGSSSVPPVESSLEHAVSAPRASPRTTGAASSRTRSITGSALHKRSLLLGRETGQPRSHRTGHRSDRLAARRTGAVAPADGLGQVHRSTARGGRPGRRVARPRGDEGVLALEEAVAPDAAGGPALAGVLGERRHLHRSRLGAGQRGRRPRRGHHGVVTAGQHAEPHHALARGHPDAGDAAAGAALRAHGAGPEVEQ